MLTPSKEFKEIFGIKADGKTDERFVFKKGSFRFSVLTSRLLRVEFVFQPVKQFSFIVLKEKAWNQSL